MREPITSVGEMEASLRQLRILEAGLSAMQAELAAKNPELLHVTAPSYEKRIALLRREIANFLHAYPEFLSTLLSLSDKYNYSHLMAESEPQKSEAIAA
jgi:hypothetical protein